MRKIQLILLTLILATNRSAFAEVESMSLENFKNIEGERYWEVSVLCNGDSQEKLMKRIVGGNKQWCSTADSSLCDENKFTLSRLMCGSDEIVEATTEAQGTGEQAEPSGSEPNNRKK